MLVLLTAVFGLLVLGTQAGAHYFRSHFLELVDAARLREFQVVQLLQLHVLVLLRTRLATQVLAETGQRCH